jgi:antirestriction protein ArdC
MSIDVYQTVTDKMVAALEAGTVPWRKPWNSVNGRPQNMDGRPYRGVNVMLLSLSGYESPFWLTFKQAKARGGSVNKGERSTMVVFWRQIKVEDKGTGEDRTIPLLRYYNVFNLDQTSDVKLPERVVRWQDRVNRPIELVIGAQAIVTGYPNPPVIDYGAEAFYVPAFDRITVPRPGDYARPEEFYSTLFHEMGHSTGHPDRLNRSIANTFGSHDYGREELVAEMTAAFLCAEAGIEATHENSAAYLSSWIATIREDNRAVVTAAGAAQRAADHILGRSVEVEGSVTEPEGATA